MKIRIESNLDVLTQENGVFCESDILPRVGDVYIGSTGSATGKRFKVIEVRWCLNTFGRLIPTIEVNK